MTTTSASAAPSVSAQSKIALYYHFAPVADPVALKLFQRELCKRLELTGRIIVSPHGINGTVGGPIKAVKEYVKITKQYPGFEGLEIKWSDGGAEDFPRLSVKDRPELVAFDAPEEIQVDENGVVGTAPHLKPDELHELVDAQEAAGQPVVFFDGRNAFEAQIGKFKNAVVPDVTTSRDFIAELESGKYDHLKDQPVVTYCTGGIRCEALTVLMANRGFNNLYQLDGGIVRYGEARGDSGLWEGSLYVFDERMSMDFTDDAVTIGECIHCSAATSQMSNCTDPGCKTQQVLCEDCQGAAQDDQWRCHVCAAAAVSAN